MKPFDTGQRPGSKPCNADKKVSSAVQNLTQTQSKS